MNSMMKWVAATIGLLCLAIFFPFVLSFYETADNNGTGILWDAGTAINNNFIQFLVVGVPAVIMIVIILYVVRKDSKP